ncbi:MAG: YdiU family protein [Alphaproteobacteria bacterium]|nr:YdiU family protein [Alphaproteobacteria bacterium]
MLILPIHKQFATLGNTFYSNVTPKPLPDPEMVVYSAEAAALVNLPKMASYDIIRTFSGNNTFQDYAPLAAVYAGHQFGYYVPELGDGRAMMIAESQGYEIQIKGSGKTPYSRFGDGRAVLRSSIREFLCSEAMAALDIPSTRALCVINGSEPVQRERVETAAMLTRLAPSHIRFGSFEYFYYNNDMDALRKLADFCVSQYFSEAANAKNPYAAMLTEISQRTGKLIAQWQAVGFAHGVMNTDNMSVCGLTLDYGPFGFHDAFNAHYICNHSDENGRYAFDQQPAVGLWNLNALARALSPLMTQEEIVVALRSYEPAFIMHYETHMRLKLGLHMQHPDDGAFIASTLKLLHDNSIDYTLFFRCLSHDCAEEIIPQNSVDSYRQWKLLYDNRLNQESLSPQERKTAMLNVNPKYILRNYLAENAIAEAESGNYAEVQTLHSLLKTPYDEQPEYDAYAQLPPKWAKDICISCSS